MKRNIHTVPQQWQCSSAARYLLPKEIHGLSDQEIIDMLAKWRWGAEKTQVCPKCGLVESHIWRGRKQAWRCKSCAAEFSVTSGTPFAHHRISLRTIATGIVLFINSGHAISARALARNLGVSENTAWSLRTKIREALSRSHPNKYPSGIEKINAIYIRSQPYMLNEKVKSTREGER